jgi:hypothetical protein
MYTERLQYGKSNTVIYDILFHFNLFSFNLKSRINTKKST